MDDGPPFRPSVPQSGYRSQTKDEWNELKQSLNERMKEGMDGWMDEQPRR